MHFPKTIAFLVKKPAQFDVPLFQYIATAGGQYRFTVYFLNDPSGESLHDPELKRRSGWDMDLASGYHWHSLGGKTPGAFLQLLASDHTVFVITNGYQGPYDPYIKALKKSGLPVALRIDSVGFGRSSVQNLLRKWVLRRLYKPFSIFLTTGKAGYQFLDSLGITKRRQGWFPYCIDNTIFGKPALQTPSIREQLHIPVDAYVVLGVCKFNEREKPMELLRAFKAWQRPGTYLVMVGDGEQRQQLEAEAGEMLDQQIHFPGYVAYSVLPAFYQAADLFVHPAFYEPWGVSVQEAIAADCAVIASNKVGSGFDLIADGKNGYQYVSGRTEALTEKMELAARLDKRVIGATNESLLGQWNYQKVWNALQEAGDIVVRG